MNDHTRSVPQGERLSTEPKQPVKVNEASNPGEKITNRVTETTAPNTKDGTAD